MSHLGSPEPGGICPVPLAKLATLFKSHPADLMRLIGEMPEDARIRLSVWCFTRGPKLREVALAIAAECDERRLADMAGMLGMVLAARCREVARPGRGAPAAVLAQAS